MPRYTVHIVDPTEPPSEPVRPNETSPEVEAGIWGVDAADEDAAIAMAKELHRASYGRVPTDATITVELATD